MSDLPEPILSAIVGFIGGCLLGMAARRGRFCTLGAIEDTLYGQDTRRLRMWGLALAVAIAGTFLLAADGRLDLGRTFYVANAWNPIASILGGLVFGYGMAIAGTCGFGALARLGGGDLRAFVIVVVMGIAAFMTIGGPIGMIRVELFPPLPASGDPASFGYAHWFGEAFSIDPALPALAIAAAFGLWALSAPDFRTSPSHVFWAIVVGIAIVTGWAGTAWLAERSFDAVSVQSHSFTRPIGETILYLMTASAGGLDFAIGSVAGVLTGSVAGSISRGHFHWEACDDPRELGRQLLGAALMGIGGVVALGCSIGQGLTAFSALSFGAPIVLLSIFIGASLGLKQLIGGVGSLE